MIGADYLLSLLGFSIAMAFTPGPNNMMVMASLWPIVADLVRG